MCSRCWRLRQRRKPSRPCGPGRGPSCSTKLPAVATTSRSRRSSSSPQSRMFSPCFASCLTAGSRACPARARRVLLYSTHPARRARPPAGSALAIRLGGCARRRSADESGWTRSIAALRNRNGANPHQRGLEALVRAADAELDRLLECLFHRGGGKQSERVGRDRAIMPRAFDGVFERAVLHHQADCMLEVGVACLALFECAPPEGAFRVRSPAKGEHYGKCDLALTKIVADVLAELRRGSSIVERVIDELKRNAKIHAERPAGALLVFGARGQRRADLAGGGEEFRG